MVFVDEKSDGPLPNTELYARFPKSENNYFKLSSLLSSEEFELGESFVLSEFESSS